MINKKSSTRMKVKNDVKRCKKLIGIQECMKVQQVLKCICIPLLFGLNI